MFYIFSRDGWGRDRRSNEGEGVIAQKQKKR